VIRIRRHGKKCFAQGGKSTQNGKMRIGVISDTHSHVPSSVVERLHGVEELWHLGDVCEPSVLNLFLDLECPQRVVRGNCDSCTDWPLTLDLERGGVKFHLEHIPPRQAPRGCQVLLHGHTHTPRDEWIAGVRWLNPGTVGKPNKGAPASFAILDVAEGAIRDWRILRVATL
jgi:putative phosphoesterase